MPSFDHEEIYSLAKHYDKINDFDFDIPFYKKYSLGKKVLELGCGTGRVCIPLIEDGYDIEGVDISKKMLLEGENKAKEKQLNFIFHNKDIVNFNLGKQYDLILCIHNSFSHVNGLKNLKLFFNSVHKHLKNNGTFILQVFNPDFYFFTRDPNEKFPLKTYKDPNSEEMVELSENNFYDDESQINYIKWYFKIGDQELIKSWNQRVYYPQELDYLVQLFNFEIVAKFGDFEETPFEELPDTQILILKKNVTKH